MPRPSPERVGGAARRMASCGGEIHDRQAGASRKPLLGLPPLPVCQLRDRRRQRPPTMLKSGIPAYGRAPLAHRHLLVVGVGVDARNRRPAYSIHHTAHCALKYCAARRDCRGSCRASTATKAALLQVEVVARRLGSMFCVRGRSGVFRSQCISPERRVFHPPVARCRSGW